VRVHHRSSPSMLTLAPDCGLDEMCDDLPWVSMSDSCRNKPLDPPWTAYGHEDSQTYLIILIAAMVLKILKKERK
jgi:hypothetical protein